MSEIAVVFRFPRSAEIRYLAQPPAPGARVRSSDGRVWIVAEILASGRNTYTAYCVARQGRAEVPRPARQARVEMPRRPRHEQVYNLHPPRQDREDLATRLLELARQSIHGAKSIRRRYKMRHYIP